MRVVHVIGSLDPVFGGPPLAAAALAVAQAALNARVRILSYATAQPTRDALRGIPGAARVEAHLVPWKGRWRRASGIDSSGVSRAMVIDADFVHLHGVWEPLLRVAATACRRAGVPYAVSPHGMLDPWSLQQGAVKKKLAMWMGYRRMLSGAAFIHALNEDERALLKPLQLHNAVEVIPNGIFPDQFVEPESLETLHAHLPQVKDLPYILFLSRLHYKKGLDYLADAFAQVAQQDKRTVLVVAGPDEGGREAFQRRIAALGIAARVHLTGPIYGEAKLAALAHATVFCLPSRQEGFSMAIIEALASGTPCVISEACHFPEVQTRGAGRVVALDAAAIAGALTSILGDTALQSSMGEAARSLSKDFAWPTIAERALAAYQRAIDGGVI